MKEFIKKIEAIQTQIKVKKGERNNFGNYDYRSFESILSAIKWNLGGLVLTVSDELILIGEKRYYVKATATITDGINKISNVGWAREAELKKGMDESQITGSASSYARKYAISGLILLENAKDSDAQDNSHYTGSPTKQSAPTQSAPTQSAPKQEFKPFTGGGGKEASEKQLKLLKTNGVHFTEPLLMAEASKLIDVFFKTGDKNEPNKTPTKLSNFESALQAQELHKIRQDSEYYLTLLGEMDGQDKEKERATFLFQAKIDEAKKAGVYDA
tara:strand:- start:272 stop:1087 length:816 start_codon:yes stop_codon:yes gene_type:complete